MMFLLSRFKSFLVFSLAALVFSRDTVDLCRIDMIGEHQPLIINTFVFKNVDPVKAQLSSHGRVVSFFVVVLYSAVYSVLYVAVEIVGENRAVTISKWT